MKDGTGSIGLVIDLVTAFLPAQDPHFGQCRDLALHCPQAAARQPCNLPEMKSLVRPQQEQPQHRRARSAEKPDRSI